MAARRHALDRIEGSLPAVDYQCEAVEQMRRRMGEMSGLVEDLLAEPAPARPVARASARLVAAAGQQG